MPVKKLKEFLDSQQVKYVAINHSLAYKDFERLVQPKTARIAYGE